MDKRVTVINAHAHAGLLSNKKGILNICKDTKISDSFSCLYDTLNSYKRVISYKRTD